MIIPIFSKQEHNVTPPDFAHTSSLFLHSICLQPRQPKVTLAVLTNMCQPFVIFL